MPGLVTERNYVMAVPHSYFTAGQRYVRFGSPVWRADHQLTILAVSRDLLGTVWITYRGPDGEERTGLATYLATAIAAGEVVPVINGPVALC